jgi:hypothetical protein
VPQAAVPCDRLAQKLDPHFVLTPDNIDDIDGTHSAKIGAFVTNDVSNIHFFDHAGLCRSGSTAAIPGITAE